MKRIVGMLLVGTLVASFAAPASAGKAKKVSLYLHGNHPIGEMVEWISETGEGTTMVMDTNEPTAPAPKSFGIFQPFNEQCTGNSLFPSWQGKVSGTIVGPIKIHGHFVSAPTKVRVRLWNDIPFGSCTSTAAGVEEYVDPKFEEVVDLPGGHAEVEITLPNKKLKVVSNLILEFSQAGATSQGRILYDSSAMGSMVEFNCAGC